MKLVYLSPVPLQSYSQRPHFMVRYFAEELKFPVLWVNPYPTRLPKPSDFTNFGANKSADRIQSAIEGVLQISTKAFPVEPLQYVAAINNLAFAATIRQVKKFIGSSEAILGIGKPSHLGIQLLYELRWRKSFIDLMDDYAQFYSGLSRRSMMNTEKELIEKVGHVFCSSTNLLKKIHTRVPARLIENAYPMNTLSPIEPQKAIEKTVGFIGTMGAWFDWDRTIQLAQIAPEFNFKLIGPCVHQPPSKLPSNIRLLPACAHEDVAKHIHSFGIGLIPFKLNELSKSIDPIKYYEYRAFGLPIISTSFGAMQRRIDSKHVFDLNSILDGSRCIDSVFRARSTPTETYAFRSENGWDQRFEDMKRELDLAG